MAKFPLAVVTGGAHRLGRAFALTLAYEGYAVLIHYHRSSQHAAKTITEIKTFGVCIDHDCAGLRRATPRHLIAEIGHVLELG